MLNNNDQETTPLSFCHFSLNLVPQVLVLDKLPQK